MAFDIDRLTGHVTAPAKVNLTLRITGKRADGYHLLNSVVVFTAFGDGLTIEPHDADVLETTGPFIALLPEVDEANLCMRAITRLRAAHPDLPPLRIRLDKQIPIGAGLGGGSADAAAILRHVNAAAHTPLAADDLNELAAPLGADVTVCLRTNPQFMAGIGDQVTPLSLADNPAILLVNPNIPVLTGPVFSQFAAQNTGFSAAIDLSNRAALSAADIVAIGNDLTRPATMIEPQIGQVIAALSACDGIITAAMSGSGASCFGLFPSDHLCAAAADRLQDLGMWAVPTRIL